MTRAEIIDLAAAGQLGDFETFVNDVRKKQKEKEDKARQQKLDQLREKAISAVWDWICFVSKDRNLGDELSDEDFNTLWEYLIETEKLIAATPVKRDSDEDKIYKYLKKKGLI